MAKQRGNLDDIFRKTEPAARPPAPAAQSAPSTGEAVPKTGRTISVGVGLKEGEVAELDRIVEELEITRNALMRYAIRYFLTQYAAGSVNLARDVESPEAKKRLKMP
jgi:hypothetical protein